MQRIFHVQPYKILPNKVIAEIIAAQPKTQEQLNKVKGLPKDGFRNGKFGKAVVTIINHWPEIVDFELVGDKESGYDIEFRMSKSTAFN